MRSDPVIGVDLGGTKILAGLVDRDGEIRRTVELQTPGTSEDAVLRALGDVVEQVAGGDSPLAVGLGVPCNFDRSTSRCFRATNLPLTDVEFAEPLRQRFGVPVGVENDGNAAALAEWRLGAARGADDFVMLTLGTGVGGGLVLGGRLYRGWAELGHVVVEAGGPPCQGNCHGRGHLEAVASGHAADRRARELYGDGATAHDLVERARGGETDAVAALERIGELLGAAIGSFVNMFDPEVVVVGGGFGAAAGDLVLGPAREAARREAIQPADDRLRIVEAQLGEEAGLIGAALVGLEALDGLR
ncbi:MAG TPA: ROK family protein [Gaiellaceae bacterium]|nr:ROK family protein [Gaiellaceae bacterium]